MTYRMTVGQTGQRANLLRFFDLSFVHTGNLIFGCQINIVAGHFLFWYYKILGSFNEAIRK